MTPPINSFSPPNIHPLKRNAHKPINRGLTGQPNTTPVKLRSETLSGNITQPIQPPYMPKITELNSTQQKTNYSLKPSSSMSYEDTFLALHALAGQGDIEALKKIKEFAQSNHIRHLFLQGDLNGRVIMRHLYNHYEMYIRDFLIDLDPTLLFNQAAQGNEDALLALILIAEVCNSSVKIHADSFTSFANPEVSGTIYQKLKADNYLNAYGKVITNKFSAKKAANFDDPLLKQYQNGISQILKMALSKNKRFWNFDATKKFMAFIEQEHKNGRIYSQNFYSMLAVLISRVHDVDPDNHFETLLQDKTVSYRTAFMIMTYGGKDIHYSVFSKWHDNRFSADIESNPTSGLGKYFASQGASMETKVGFLLTLCQFNEVYRLNNLAEVLPILIEAIRDNENILRNAGLIINLLLYYQNHSDGNLLFDPRFSAFAKLLDTETSDEKPFNEFKATMMFLTKLFFSRVNKIGSTEINSLGSKADSLPKIDFHEEIPDLLVYNPAERSFEMTSTLFFYPDEKWYTDSAYRFMDRHHGELRYKTDNNYIKAHPEVSNKDFYLVAINSQQITLTGQIMPHSLQELFSENSQSFQRSLEQNVHKAIWDILISEGIIDVSGKISTLAKPQIDWQKRGIDLTKLGVTSDQLNKRIANMLGEYQKGVTEKRSSRVIFTNSYKDKRVNTLASTQTQAIAHRGHSYHILKTFLDLLNDPSLLQSEPDPQKRINKVAGKLIEALSCGSLRDVVSKPMSTNYYLSNVFADYNTGRGNDNNRLQFSLNETIVFANQLGQKWDSAFDETISINNFSNIRTGKKFISESAKSALWQELIKTGYVVDLKNEAENNPPQAKLNVTVPSSLFKETQLTALFKDGILIQSPNDPKSVFIAKPISSVRSKLKTIGLSKETINQMDKAHKHLNARYTFDDLDWGKLGNHGFTKKNLSKELSVILSNINDLNRIKNSGIILPNYPSLALVRYIIEKLGIKVEALM